MAGLQAWVKYDQITEDAGKFIIQPLNKGLGVTLGNSLRRIMLSSIEGASMVAIKIPGITHEFTTIPNIVEDVLEIIKSSEGKNNVKSGKSDDETTKEQAEKEATELAARLKKLNDEAVRNFDSKLKK